MFEKMKIAQRSIEKFPNVFDSKQEALQSAAFVGGKKVSFLSFSLKYDLLQMYERL